MTPPPPEPLFFGSVARPLFGWLHRAAPGLRPSLGVILCNPFGYEAISAHRTFRHFAQLLANAGVPAFRFDYDGTGNSAGSDLDPGRLEAWVSSARQAGDTLRRGTGCERLVYCGIRLGATLAALATRERSDVAGLIAIVPVVNAKAYMRELRALQMAGRAADATAAGADDDTEVTGFVLTAQTRTAVSGVDLTKLENRPAPNVLILDRNDLPGNERWATHLQSTGAIVERHAVPGYTEMMLSPHAAVVPAEMLRLAMSWLGTLTSGMPASGPSQTSAFALGRTIQLPAPEEAGTPVTETAMLLEPDQNVFCILTQPTRPAPTQPAPKQAILLLNAGGTHHIGPNRMYVSLARQWASRGYAVMRLDLSGIGDSPPRPGEPENAIYTTRATEDIAQAANYLRKQLGTPKVHAIGLCSGAYHALKTAVGGAPVDSVVMINPLTFFWKEGMSLDAPLPDQLVIAETQRYQKTALRLASWLKLIRGEVNIRRILQIMVRRTTSVIAHLSRDIGRRLHFRLQDDLGHELETVARRRVRMLFVFAADDPGIELLRAQGRSIVRKLEQRRQLRVEIIDGSDHTFTARQARARLAPILESVLAEPLLHD